MSRLHDPILVTGAAGFIGSHLIERLVHAGHAVRAFVRYDSSGSMGWLTKSPCRDKIEIIRGDIRDYDSVSRAVAGCPTIFHLAALIGIPYSYVSPLAYVKTNVEGTYNVLEACRQTEAGNVMITSTSEVYGEALRFPIAEDHPVNARSPYAASKIGADQMALSYHAAFGVPLKLVRPFNVFGPRQSARAVIPSTVAQVLAGKKEILLGNLEPTRDWTYVLDAVAGLQKIAESEALLGQIIHIGTGREIAVSRMVEQVGEILGREIRVEVDSLRARDASSEISRLLCDSRKLRETTGWTPAYTFEAGLREMIAWMRENTGGSSPQAYAI